MPDYLQNTASAEMVSRLDVGARLKAVREQNGLSQRELAKRSNVTHSSISMIEQGQNSPSIHSLEKILTGIPMTLAHFFMCDMNHPAKVVYRSTELTIHESKESCISTCIIPHKNSASNLHFQKVILKVGADTGATPLSSVRCISGFVVAGELELTANLQICTLDTNDAFRIPVGQAYRLRNLSPICECVLLVCET